MLRPKYSVMDRAKRQSLILDLLATEPLRNQEALVAALADRGVKTTQATLSRDLRELGVVKGAGGYMLPSSDQPQRDPAYSSGGLQATRSLERALRSHLLTATPGVGMVICKTAPGHAQVVALELDRTPPAGVIGTVGGDDTIFVAVNEPARVESLTTELVALAGLTPVAEPEAQP